MTSYYQGDQDEANFGIVHGVRTDFYCDEHNTRIKNGDTLYMDTFNDASDIEDETYDYYMDNPEIYEDNEKRTRRIKKYRYKVLTQMMHAKRRARGEDKLPTVFFRVDSNNPVLIYFPYKPPQQPPQPQPQVLEEESSAEKKAQEEVEEKEAISVLEERTKKMISPPKPINYQESSPMEIVKFFNQTVMHQEGTTDLAEAVLAVRSGGGPEPEDKNIVACVISGTSGCGKTEAALQARKLFNMEHDNVHYIYYHFGSYKTEDIHAQMVGVSQGYRGYGDPCLVDKLNDALEHNRLKKEDQTGKKITKKSEIEALYPKVIYIHIDELDKAHPDIMDSLNNLLDKGYMCAKSPKIPPFNLPVQTTLFIVFTANFGEQALIHYGPQMDYMKAVEEVRTSMKHHGFKECDIGRFSHIIPFKPLSREKARAILKDKLPVFIKKYTEKCKKYSPVIHMSEKDQNAFVENCLDRGYSIERGIRQAVFNMKNELKTKQDFQLDHLKQHIDTKKVSLPLNPPPEMKFNSIEFREHLNTILLKEESKDMELALGDTFAEMGIQRCLQRKTSIDYLSLSHESMNKPFIGILAPRNVTINFNVKNYNNHSSSTDALLLEKYEKQMKELESLKQQNEQLLESLKRKQDNLNEIVKDPSLTRNVKRKINNCIKNDVPSFKKRKVETEEDEVMQIEYRRQSAADYNDDSSFSSSEGDNTTTTMQLQECPICKDWKLKNQFIHKVQSKSKAYEYQLDICTTCRKKSTKTAKRTSK